MLRKSDVEVLDLLHSGKISLSDTSMAVAGMTFGFWDILKYRVSERPELAQAKVTDDDIESIFDILFEKTLDDIYQCDYSYYSMNAPTHQSTEVPLELHLQDSLPDKEIPPKILSAVIEEVFYLTGRIDFENSRWDSINIRNV